MRTYFSNIQDIIDKKVECPLPLEVIPNYMGINLCSVDKLSWQKQEDGQLTNLTIYFLPEEFSKDEEKKTIYVEVGDNPKEVLDKLKESYE